MTFSETVEAYVAAKSSVRHRKTIYCHRLNARRMAEFFERDPEIGELSDGQLKRFFDWRSAKVAASTLNSEASSILAVLKWAAGKQLCVCPDITAPAAPRRLPRALTKQQAGNLIRAARSLTGEWDGIPAGIRWEAYLRLSINTAERIGAIRGLEWGDIYRDHVIYRAEVRKNMSGDICRDINGDTAAAIERLQAKGEPKPFAWLHETHIYPPFHALCQLAGLPEWVTPHTLRKTAASHCEHVRDAQTLLGHSSLRMTTDRYIDTTARGRKPAPHQGLLDALREPKAKRPWLLGFGARTA